MVDVQPGRLTGWRRQGAAFTVLLRCSSSVVLMSRVNMVRTSTLCGFSRAGDPIAISHFGNRRKPRSGQARRKPQDNAGTRCAIAPSGADEASARFHRRHKAATLHNDLLLS